MRVLQINSVCGTGSTGRLAVQISDHLDALGIENSIAYGFGHSDRPHTMRFGNMLDAHWHSFLSRKFCLQGYGSVCTTGKLLRYIRRYQPTVVHLHNIHGHYLHFPRLFRFLAKAQIPVVWTFHDCWPMTGKCTHFTQAGCEKWKTQCDNCPQLATYPDSTRDRSRRNHRDKKHYFSLPDSLQVVTVSRWLKETAQQSCFQNRPIQCIYNGIDLQVFQPTSGAVRQELGIGDRFMILGVASQWKTSKGFDAFCALADRLDEDSVVVLVGVTEQQKQALPPRVIGITRTENATQLAQLYTAADVLLNLSTEETFGLVVAEALACGTPAVVMNSTACPEVVDASTGIVVECDDPQLVDEALKAIRTNGKQAYTPHCVERARREFSMEKMQEQYAALYQRMEKNL